MSGFNVPKRPPVPQRPGPIGTPAPIHIPAPTPPRQLPNHVPGGPVPGVAA